ncbi:MAG: IS200/IS605 family transposase [Candidatus Electrothrix sp. GW3-4]|uniref:IS200/IS605 family transposase n=1 Tax=Candidatus Electrothrix sp. GW3-4 TaxID=3126740 RepID=UPI0030D47EB0
MPQSLSRIFLHLIFSTRKRIPFLVDAELRDHTHAYLAEVCRQLGVLPLRINGTEDHVHILCAMSRTRTVADLVKELKRTSSKWLKQQGEELLCFYWQGGYGAFSVSPSHVDEVERYIACQPEHHKTLSFQDEFRRILKKYGVQYDEQYVWD